MPLCIWDWIRFCTYSFKINDVNFVFSAGDYYCNIVSVCFMSNLCMQNSTTLCFLVLSTVTIVV